jgi:hypothetical protein
MVEEKWWGIVQERVRSQAFDHWREFASIVASGNVGAVLLVAGIVVTKPNPTNFQVFLLILDAVSFVAVVLAYYSIQVGCCVTVGEVRFSEIGSSFIIAGAQFAMPLWVGHIANSGAVDGLMDWPVQARHWLLFASAFSVAASMANAASQRRQPTTGPEGWSRYRRAQYGDRIAALVIGGLLLLLWGLTEILMPDHPIGALAFMMLGIAIALAGFCVGLASQRRTMDDLSHSLGLR